MIPFARFRLRFGLMDFRPGRTFMTLKNPSIFFRAMVLAAQGVFYNAFCKFVSLAT